MRIELIDTKMLESKALDCILQTVVDSCQVCTLHTHTHTRDNQFISIDHWDRTCVANFCLGCNEFAPLTIFIRQISKERKREESVCVVCVYVCLEEKD